MREGVLVSADVWVEQGDYAHPPALTSKLEAYMDRLRDVVAVEEDGEESCPPLVVFPELIGAWYSLALVPGGRWAGPLHLMLCLTLRHPWAVAHAVMQQIRKGAWRRGLTGLLQRALFQVTASHTLEHYYSLFSHLARRSHCYIVAGSAFLPPLAWQENPEECPVIESDSGLLHNTALCFDPSGRVIAVITKRHPVLDEVTFLDKGPVDEERIVACGPWGRVGVLICADSWYADCVEGVCRPSPPPHVLAVPSFSEAEAWNREWTGYDQDAPADSVKDVGTLTLRQAWRQYAVPGRCARACSSHRTALYAVNTFFHGRVLGLQLGGQSIISQDVHLMAISSFPLCPPPDVPDLVLYRVPLPSTSSSDGDHTL